MMLPLADMWSMSHCDGGERQGQELVGSLCLVLLVPRPPWWRGLGAQQRVGTLKSSVSKVDFSITSQRLVKMFK